MADELDKGGNPDAGEQHLAGGEGNEPKPVDLKDDQLVQVVVDGKPVTKPWGEVKGHVMRVEDYTRKTQGVSAKMKELQTLYDGLTVKQKELLEKEAGIDALLGRQKPKEKDDVADPDEVVSVGQLQKILAQHAKGLEEKFSSTLSETVGRTEQERTFQRWEEKITDTVDKLVKENPLLGDIPELALVLKREARKESPADEQDMISAVVKAGKRLNETLEKRFEERTKERATRKQKLSDNGPVRPGGAPQFEAPKKSYGNNRKINWNELESDVIAALEADDQ